MEAASGIFWTRLECPPLLPGWFGAPTPSEPGVEAVTEEMHRDRQQPTNETETIRSKTDLAAEVHRLLIEQEHRTGKRVKRSALARKIGVSDSSLYAYLNGTTLTPTDTFDRLLDALDVTAHERRRLSTARDTLDIQEKLPAAQSEQPMPRQLPAPPRLFTGRDGELAALTAALENAAEQGATMVVSAIGGMGGIGKTWLALHWAHTNIDRFPDGQLHVNLRGFDPTGDPMSPGTAVRGFLHALDVDPAAIPVNLDAQAALYRSLVAGKRLLVVLDNARDTAQVTPLLPGSPSCTAIVTSRHELAGLITEHGAHLVDLDVLPDAEAQELLTRHLGHDQVAAEPTAVAELLDCCAGLPLAISIVAARLRTRPSWTVRGLAERLRDGHRRLDEFSVGDRSVTAVFALSYQHLSGRQQHLFRLLGLHPGPDFDAYSAASLGSTDVGTAERILDDLVDVHLLQQPTPGRWRFHDLIRHHAYQAACDTEPHAGRQDALTRLLNFYLHTAFAADRLLSPPRKPIQLADAADCHPHPLNDQGAAAAWFEAEHPNLLATQRLAADQGWHTAAWQLAWTLTTFHWRQGHLHDDLAVWHAGLVATQQLDDPVAQTHANRLLGHAYARVGRHADAVRHLQTALALAEQSGDRTDQAHTHLTLSRVWEPQGDNRKALEHATHALHLCQTLDNPVWEAQALNTVGWYHARLGHHEQARSHCEAALALSRHHDERDCMATTLDSLGYIAHLTGQYTRAVDYYHQALALLHDLGHAYDEAGTLDRLAQTYHKLGQVQQAHAALRQALALYQTQHRTVDADRIQQQLAALDEQPNDKN